MVYNVLRVAWANHGAVRMKEVDDQTMEFVFESPRSKEQILDLSPWSVNGHCLVLKECLTSSSLQDVNFAVMDTWVQIYGLSFDMYNSINAQRFAELVGKFRFVEPDHLLQQRSYLRVKVELDTTIPLRDGFWWTNTSGVQKWATIRYERLSDYCYGCGRLGHASTNCVEEVAREESDP